MGHLACMCLALQFYFCTVSARKVSAIELIREGRKAPPCDNRRGDLTNYARHLTYSAHVSGPLPSPTVCLLADYFQPAEGETLLACLLFLESQAKTFIIRPLSTQ